jgi:hypothetical protein
LECLRKLNGQELQDFYFAPNIVRMTKGVPMGEEEKFAQCVAGDGSENLGACGGFNLPWIAVTRILSVILLGWEKQRCYSLLAVKKAAPCTDVPSDSPISPHFT